MCYSSWKSSRERKLPDLSELPITWSYSWMDCAIWNFSAEAKLIVSCPAPLENRWRTTSGYGMLLKSVLGLGWLSSGFEYNKEGVDRVDLDYTQLDLFYSEGGETVKKVAQRSCGFSHYWRCSCSVWMGLRITWFSERYSCSWQGLCTRCSLNVPSNLNHSVILCIWNEVSNTKE